MRYEVRLHNKEDVPSLIIIIIRFKDGGLQLKLYPSRYLPHLGRGCASEGLNSDQKTWIHRKFCFEIHWYTAYFVLQLYTKV